MSSRGMKVYFSIVGLFFAFLIGDGYCYMHAKFPERMCYWATPGGGYYSLYKFGWEPEIPSSKKRCGE